jgi:hypothetical protein
MYVIKIGEKYVQFNNGQIKKVDTVEDATHYKTENGTKWAIEEINRYNYKDVSYEEVTIK